MLIEGAIRFGKQAEELLRKGDQVAAATPLLRVLDIVGELLAGVREKNTALNQRVSELYSYMFRRVAEAKINADVAILTEVLQLLEYERQTWQLVCDKLGSGAAAATAGPHTAAFNMGRSQPAPTGISFQA
jgi:flagellar secretion chaperone FliS